MGLLPSSSLCLLLPRRAGPLRKVPLPILLTRIELGTAPSASRRTLAPYRDTLPCRRLAVPGSSTCSWSLWCADPVRLDESPDDAPERRALFPEEPTTIWTFRMLERGVLTSGIGSETTGFSGGSTLGGRLACLDADSERLICGGRAPPTPPAGVVLNLTTLFLGPGTGLVSRLRMGDVGLDDETWALPALTCLLVCRTFWPSASRSAVADEVDLLRALLLLVATGCAADCLADAVLILAAAIPASSDADVPSFSRAFVSALSFIGTGISSSELSLAAGYCWDSAFASTVAMLAAGSTGFNSLRPSWGRDVGRRRACRALTRRPMDEKWLPWPIGVGDAADMLGEMFRSVL